jgi:DeoR family transcriptional regulator, fructose operon transcriptional repressor
MLAEERRAKIREILSQKSTITISELVDLFGTSEMTIRRDLDELEVRGICQRIYGGAMSLRVTEYPNTVYPTFSYREQAQSMEKTAIAKAGVNLVHSGDTVAIDSGTTAAYLAHALRASSSITVISNSLGVLAQLYDISSINLVSPGGTLSQENMNAGGGDLLFVGPITNTTLRNFRPNIAFIGTSGITIKDGISNLSLFQAEIKRTLIDIAEEVILITDHTKFGLASGFLVAGVQQFHKVITDVLAPRDDVEMLRALGVEVILVEPDRDQIHLSPLPVTFFPNKPRIETSEPGSSYMHLPENP